METNKVVIGVVAVAIALVITVTCAIPIISDMTNITGTPVTKVNTGTGHTFKQMEVGDVLLVHSVYSNGSRTDTWTLNGETVLNDGITTLTWDWGLISDAYFMQVNAAGNSAVGSGQVISDTPSSPSYYRGADSDNPDKSFSWTLTDSTTLTLEVLIGDTPVSGGATITVSWAYVVSTVDDGAYMSAQVTTNSYYAQKGNKDVILAGNYTTGDLDTGYYYGKDGVLTILNSNYTGTVNFEQELSSGTTDIYDTLLTVSITDGNDTETFSPYRALVPYEVSGHATSGMIYTMLGVIPILIVIGIVLGTIGMIAFRK